MHRPGLPLDSVMWITLLTPCQPVRIAVDQTGASSGPRPSSDLVRALRSRGSFASVVPAEGEESRATEKAERRAARELIGAYHQAQLRLLLDRIPLVRYPTLTESFWTIGWLPCRVDRLMREFAPDIVHLHWVGAGFLPVQALKQFRRPIVWTLRDMWSFTGGCHYSAGCQRYQDACGACPQLRSRSKRG